MAGFGESKAAVPHWARGLDLDFIVQDLMSGGVLLVMHLYLPIWSQVRLGRVVFFSKKLRTEMLWIQVVLDLHAIRKTLHLHLGADLSRQDALVVNRRAEDCCIGGSICRDWAGRPILMLLTTGGRLLPQSTGSLLLTKGVPTSSPK